MFLNVSKLRNQIILIIVTSIIIVTIMQITVFAQLYRTAKDETGKLISEAINQVEEEINWISQEIKNVSYFVSYDKYSQAYILEKDPMKRVELSSIVSNLLRNFESANEHIDEIILVDNNNWTISSGSLTDTTIINNITKEYIYPDQEDKALYCTPVLSNSDGEKFIAFILPIFSVTYKNNFNKRIGTGIILCNIKRFDRVIRNKIIRHGSVIYLFDSEFNLISGNTLNTQEEIKMDDNAIKFYNQIINQYSDSGEYFYKSKEIEIAGWKIISAVPKDTISYGYRWIRLFFTSALILMIVILSIMGAMLNRNINTPITQIMNFLDNVDYEDFSKRIKVSKSSNEIGAIMRHINKMLDKLNEFTNEKINSQTMIYKANVLKKQAELIALQSQINPHFLYNVMDCIRSMALSKGLKEIAEMSTALAKIFRYSISSKDMVSIKDEIDCIRNYLKIISIRYCNRIEVLMKIDPDLMECKTLKMILQPIVENAVYHGLECKKGKGVLSITGNYQNKDRIKFVIEDNGLGMTKDVLSKIYERLNDSTDEYILDDNPDRPIGLINIHLRIRMAFGNDFGISIESEENSGTSVTVCIPKI